MRKWTYLVAALLMGGVSTSLTSCIDNDEPAGITELRGAKAAFIKAKADYEAALTQIQLVKVEREKIELEKDKIDQQLKQLEYERQQAKDELYKQELSLQKDVLVEEYKQKMLSAQSATAIAQQALVEALNSLEIAELEDRDNKYYAAISGLRGTLLDDLWELTMAQQTLYTAQVNKINYESDNTYFKAGLELQKAASEKDLEILQGLLANYEATSSADMADLKTQLANIESQIIGLAEKDKKAWQDLQALKSGEEFVNANNKVQEYLIALHKDASFTVKAEKIDAAIQEELYNVLTAQYVNTQAIDQFYNNTHDALTSDIVIDKKLTTSVGSSDLKYEDLATKLKELATSIINKGQTLYANEYNTLIGGAYVSATDIFDENQQVKSSYSTKVEAEKTRLSNDKATIKANFDAALKAWVDNYIAFQKALKDYGGYNTTKPYDDILNAINAHVKAYNKDASAITLATIQGWRTEIYNYLTLRATVDGTTEQLAKDFNEQWGIANNVDKITDATKADFITAISSPYSIIGNQRGLNLSAEYDESYTGASTLKKFITAEMALFQNSPSGYKDLNNAIEPVLNNGAAPTDYTTAIPEDIEATSGLYGEYYASINFDEIYPDFAAYEKWLATYEYIIGEEETIAKDILALNDSKDAVVKEFNDAYQKVWTAELEGYLILGGETVNGYTPQQWISNDNPYHEFMMYGSSGIENGNGVTFSNRSEYSKLQNQLNIYQAAIDAGKLSYVTYKKDYTGNYVYSTTNGQEALEDLIEETKIDINDVQQNIQNIVNQIDLFDKMGYDGYRFAADLQNQIDAAQRTVDEKQADVDFVNAQLQKYLDAYANDETNLPETPAE